MKTFPLFLSRSFRRKRSVGLLLLIDLVINLSRTSSSALTSIKFLLLHRRRCSIEPIITSRFEIKVRDTRVYVNYDECIRIS